MLLPCFLLLLRVLLRLCCLLCQALFALLQPLRRCQAALGGPGAPAPGAAVHMDMSGMQAGGQACIQAGMLAGRQAELSPPSDQGACGIHAQLHARRHHHWGCTPGGAGHKTALQAGLHCIALRAGIGT